MLLFRARQLKYLISNWTAETNRIIELRKLWRSATYITLLMDEFLLICLNSSHLFRKYKVTTMSSYFTDKQQKRFQIWNVPLMAKQIFLLSLQCTNTANIPGCSWESCTRIQKQRGSFHGHSQPQTGNHQQPTLFNTETTAINTVYITNIFSSLKKATKYSNLYSNLI